MAHSLGMTTEARYQHNLRVLRRRDPSITAIFDQYDHICVYSLDGSKWTKHGYEGSMFLFESSTYPPYGFYILNRSGSADYIQRLYPEDTLSVVGTILGIKTYPEYTSQRMAAIQASLADKPTPDPFSDVYAIPNISSLTHEAKGAHYMIGLWRHEAGNRESMIDVLKRLHSYIQRNEPYPEQFRYGPGHPPPPHRLRAVPRSSSEASDSDSAAPSEVDRLFAKLIPQPSPSVTVDSLFAKLGTPAASPGSSTLLDSLFASATTVPIHSPTPAVPQVLNQDVISTLLGLPPSRTPSAASSSGARSTTTSRDGDNEEDSDSSSPASRSQPLLAVPEQGKRRIKGDVTPRTFTTNGIPIKSRGLPVPSVLEAASSVSTVRASHSLTVVSPPSTTPLLNRPLVPFEDDSALWPYTPSSLENNGTEEDPDIVELDFEETSLLSDPEAFTRVILNRKSKPEPSNTKEKGGGRRNRKKSKKDREREDIETSWDVPDHCMSYVEAQRAAAEARREFLNSPPASPSPPPLTPPPPTPPPVRAFEGQTPTMGAKQRHSATNGRGSVPIPTTPSSKGRKATNGNGKLDQELTKNIIIESLQARPRNVGGKLERNAFVREVLTLIHTDKGFVDNLYQQYTSKLA